MHPSPAPQGHPRSHPPAPSAGLGSWWTQRQKEGWWWRPSDGAAKIGEAQSGRILAATRKGPGFETAQF